MEKSVNFIKRNYTRITVIFVLFAVSIWYFLPLERSSAVLSPLLLGGYDTSRGVLAQDVSVVGNIAYVATDNTATPDDPEVYIFDTTTATQPTLVGSYNVGRGVGAIVARNGYAYLGTNKDTEELMILNVAISSNPALVGSYDLPGGSNVRALYLDSARLYVGTVVNNSGSEFYIFDTSNPLTPVLLGSYEIGAHVNGIVVHRGFAYLATSNKAKEFIALGVQNPQAITEVYSYNMPGSPAARGVTKQNERIYVVSDNNGSYPDFYVFSAGGAGSVRISSINLGSNNNDIAVVGGWAFVGTDTDTAGLKIVNIANPVAPRLYSSLNTFSKVKGIDVSAAFVHLATNKDTLEYQIVDPMFAISPIVSDQNHDGRITVVCHGDSNTQAGVAPVGDGWCERFGGMMNSANFPSINHGLGGTTITDNGMYFLGFEMYAGNRIAASLFDDHPDAMMLAFGTNDIRVASSSAADIVSEYARQKVNAESQGVKTFIALTPYFTSSFPDEKIWNAKVNKLNALIRATFSPGDILDFNSNMLSGDYQDVVHLGTLGQLKRASVAYKHLFPNTR